MLQIKKPRTSRFPETSGICIAKKFLDRFEYVSVKRLSSLLQKYSERIERRYLYMFRADYYRAVALLRKKFKSKA